MDYKAMWKKLRGFVQDTMEFYNTDTAEINNSIIEAQCIVADTIQHRCLKGILEVMNDIEIEHAK